MKILIFSQSIYPKTGGSSFVTENMVKALADRHDVAVIGGSDLIWDSVRSCRRSNAEFKYLRSQISIKFRGERFFEFFRWAFLFPCNLVSAFFYAKQFRPDHVFVVFPDGYFLLMGYYVTKWLKLPLSAYFHNTYVENRRGVSRRFASFVQGRIFSNSRNIFIISEGLNELYRRRYPHVNKFFPLVHTFNEYPKIGVLPAIGPEIKVAFTGNFNQSNLEATIRLVNILGSMPDVSLYFFTPVPEPLLRLRGIDTKLIRSIKYVSEDAYYNEIGKCSVVVLTHGFTGLYDKIEYETIFPTRTISLLLCGRPIFAHTPPRCFVTEFLKTNDCAEVVDAENEEVIASSFRLLVADAERMKKIVYHAGLTARRFYAKDVYEDVVKRLLGQ